MALESRGNRFEYELDEYGLPSRPGSVAGYIEEPAVPDGMSPERVAEAQAEATTLVAKLVNATGSGEMEATDEVIAAGLRTQRKAADQLGQLKSRIADHVREGGSSKEIAVGLNDLRHALDQINPHAPQNRSFWDRWVPPIPFVTGPRGPVRALQRIAMRYEPVSVHIASIETRLREGRTVLVRDSVEMRKLYEQVEVHQAQVAETAYFGRLLMHYLSNEIEKAPSEAKREQLKEALSDVATRVSDLVAMHVVFGHYRQAIQMVRRNNRQLGQAVERTLAIAPSVVIVGLVIQSAMVRQKAVIEITKRMQAFLGDVITANAASIKQHTVEIGDLYKNPVIALEKIEKAHDDLAEALDMASRLRDEGIAAATENIGKLTAMSNEVQERLAGLEGTRLPEIAATPEGPSVQPGDDKAESRA